MEYKYEQINEYYYDKYIKYKTKYLELKNNIMIGGKQINIKINNDNNKIILVDGTSSAGKTTICTFFSAQDFSCFQIDNYWNDSRMRESMKYIDNKYTGIHYYDLKPVELMISDGLDTGKSFLIDHISQKEVISYLKSINKLDRLFIIVVYTGLEDLARNLESRRKEGDPRGVFVFEQFADRYVKTNFKDSKKINQVNRRKFKKILLRNFKYEFISRQELENFVYKIFKKIGITDDLDHWVKLRDNFRCDYLLDTTNKTKLKIFSELEKVFNEII